METLKFNVNLWQVDNKELVFLLELLLAGTEQSNCVSLNAANHSSGYFWYISDIPVNLEVIGHTGSESIVVCVYISQEVNVCLPT